MPEVSAAKRHSISDTANATPTNQCISLSPGRVWIWVEGQMRDTWPRDFEAFSIWLHVASLSLRDAAVSACWGWHLHVNLFFFFLVLKPLSWSSLARVDHKMFSFSRLASSQRPQSSDQYSATFPFLCFFFYKLLAFEYVAGQPQRGKPVSRDTTSTHSVYVLLLFFN